jgi:hypothetical protein
MTSKLGYITQDMTEATLWWGWETIKGSMNDIEDYLVKTTEEFETDINEQKKTLKHKQRTQFDIDHVLEYIYYYDEFPYILRNSFFVSAYSLFEFDIDIICRKLKTTKQIPINLNDLSGYLLKRLKLYFKLAAVEYSFNSKTWKAINKYSKLRNCIVHSNGLLKKDDKDYKTLINYVKEKDIIKERYIISDEVAEQEIGLTRKFCEEVVETMQKFIDDAYKTSMIKEKQT